MIFQISNIGNLIMGYCLKKIKQIVCLVQIRFGVAIFREIAILALKKRKKCDIISMSIWKLKPEFERV